MILDRIRKWWKRRHFNLRQGIPIGGFLETIEFIDMIEKVKKENGIE